MKDNSIINRIIKGVKKLFTPKIKKAVIQPPKPKLKIPKHETKIYHNPPCSGIAKDAGKKRKAKIRIQKMSRVINRKTA